MRSAACLLVCLVVAGCRVMPERVPPAVPTSGPGEEACGCGEETPCQPGEPGPPWPDVVANEGLAGVSADQLLTSITSLAAAAGKDFTGLADARRNNLPYYQDTGGAHGRVYRHREAWARVALAWSFAKCGDWNNCRAQLEMHSAGQQPEEWAGVTFAPAHSGRTYVELIGEPAGWQDGPPDPMDGPPPELLDKILPRLDEWYETPANQPHDSNANRIRWARILLAYYAAGYPGEPNWYLCSDEIQHCP